MSESSLQLPEAIRALFWEYEEGSVSWDRHREFIVERVLARGDWDSIRWVRQQVGDGGLRDLLRRTRGRSLTRPQIRFWQLLLDLPEEEIRGWLSSKVREIWDRRTA